MIFKKLKQARKIVKHVAISERLREEALYEKILHEIESGLRRDGLWAKALQNGNGNEENARGLYIKYRLQSIMDEAEILEEIASSADQIDYGQSREYEEPASDDSTTSGEKASNPEQTSSDPWLSSENNASSSSKQTSSTRKIVTPDKKDSSVQPRILNTDWVSEEIWNSEHESPLIKAVEKIDLNTIDYLFRYGETRYGEKIPLKVENKAREIAMKHYDSTNNADEKKQINKMINLLFDSLSR